MEEVYVRDCTAWCEELQQPEWEVVEAAEVRVRWDGGEVQEYEATSLPFSQLDPPSPYSAFNLARSLEYGRVMYQHPVLYLS